LPARGRKKTRRPTRRRVGPKPTSSVCHQGGPVSSGLALTTTWVLSSERASASVFANAGITVSNSFSGFESPKRSGRSNDPWMVDPSEVISATFPCLTCSRKNGL